MSWFEETKYKHAGVYQLLKVSIGCHTMFLFVVFCKIGVLERNAY